LEYSRKKEDEDGHKTSLERPMVTGKSRYFLSRMGRLFSMGVPRHAVVESSCCALHRPIDVSLFQRARKKITQGREAKARIPVAIRKRRQTFDLQQNYYNLERKEGMTTTTTTTTTKATIKEIETWSIDDGEDDDDGGRCCRDDDVIRSFELSLVVPPTAATRTGRKVTKIHLSSMGASILKFLVPHQQEEENEKEDTSPCNGSKDDDDDDDDDGGGGENIGRIQTEKGDDDFSSSTIAYDDIVLGYLDGKSLYESKNPFYYQTIVGRVANRIKKGQLFMNQKIYPLEINNPPNHLHGGWKGFNHRIWKVETFGIIHQDSWCQIPYIQFTLDSIDGDQGYPGHIQISATYSLRPSMVGNGSTLRLELSAKLQEDEGNDNLSSPINLVQHSYFNLSPQVTGNAAEDGCGSGILHHTLHLESDAYTPVDSNSIPTKEIVSVKDHPIFDLSSKPRKLKDILYEIGIQNMNLTPPQVETDLKNRQPVTPYGVDHNFVVRRQPGVALPKVATLRYGTRVLHVHSSAPGVQVYTGNYLGSGDSDEEEDTMKKPIQKKKKDDYRRWSGICLETQHFPDSIRDDVASPNSGVGGGSQSEEFFAQGRCPILSRQNPEYHHVVEYTIEDDPSSSSPSSSSDDSDPQSTTARGVVVGPKPMGSDTNGRIYHSIHEMWAEQLQKKKNDDDDDGSSSSWWYRQSLEYYEDYCPSTVDGVLGGIGEISDIDLDGSRQFLMNLGLLPRPSNSTTTTTTTACECGAGIGRVTKGLLLDVCHRCDLIESCSHLLREAPDHIGNESYRCRFFCMELQHWEPPIGKYSKYFCLFPFVNTTAGDAVIVGFFFSYRKFGSPLLVSSRLIFPFSTTHLWSSFLSLRLVLV